MPTTRSLLRAFALTLCFATGVAAQRGAPVKQPQQAETPPLARFTSETLTRFSSEREFEAYLEAVREAQRRRGSDYGELRRPIRFAQAQPDSSAAQSDTPEEPLCSDPEDCPVPDEGAGEVTVTGSRISSRNLTSSSPISTVGNPSITNNQMADVEEGDIVKMIGRHLIVLQDGRLFVIDTRPNGAPGLALSDRADVYRSRHEAASWYDEMLVEGDRILVTAYSYREGASEVSVFRLDPAGRIHREGVFLISSNDYFSTTNYATRLVGNSLVVYTPYQLGRWGGFSGGRASGWPTVRRWLPAEERRGAVDQGTRLFDAAQIRRPVRDSNYPVIHTISVCPLGPGGGQELSCRATAFAGPANAELYVTAGHAYLWTTPSYQELGGFRPHRCSAEEEGNLAVAAAATVYRVAIAGGRLEVAAATGRPIDQFSFQANERTLYGLLHHDEASCRSDAPAVRLAFMTMPLDRFGQRLRDIGRRSYVPMPPTENRDIANRFTDTHLVYGSLTYDRYDPSDDEEDGEVSFARAPTFAVPVVRPRGVTALGVPHNVLRAERAGNEIVLTGYSDRTGLRVSLVSLGGRPGVSSTAHLPKRYESEGRSHAFTSAMTGNGSGIMGLPTVFYDNSREVWRSEGSDLSFLTASAGRLTSAGTIAGEDQRRDPAYLCEISCMDWYGNSRPIFVDGRIFALTGTELAEGRLVRGQMSETRRVDLTAPVARR